MLIITIKHLKAHIGCVLDVHSEESTELTSMTAEEWRDAIQEISEANAHLIPFETDNFDSPTINFLGYI